MEPLAIAHGPLRSTALRQRLDVDGVDVVFVAPNLAQAIGATRYLQEVSAIQK